MAKLYFYYSAMNAGKSTVLLQSAYNYKEKGMDTLLYTPLLDTRYGRGKIASRIGLQRDAISFTEDFNLYEHTKAELARNNNIRCVLIDEAQFLSKNQVLQVTDIVDDLALPVLAYGIRSDFTGEPFPGSKYLLVLADNLVEIKTVCSCGRKATMNARIDTSGKVLSSGSQVEIGGNDRYVSMCRKHFKKALSLGDIDDFR